MDRDSDNDDSCNYGRLGSDRFLEFEESDEDEDDSKTEFACPFCFDDFDIVGLYVHLDEEHPMEAKSGACPVCSSRVGMNLVEHVTSKHEDFFKLRRKLKLLKCQSWSASSLLRKDSLDGYVESFLRGGSQRYSSSNMEADPLLSTFIYNPPTADEPKSVQLSSMKESELAEERSDPGISERDVPPPSSSEGQTSSEGQALSRLSIEDQMERAQRCQFVQGLLWSTLIDD